MNLGANSGSGPKPIAITRNQFYYSCHRHLFVYSSQCKKVPRPQIQISSCHKFPLSSNIFGFKYTVLGISDKIPLPPLRHYHISPNLPILYKYLNVIAVYYCFHGIKPSYTFRNQYKHRKAASEKKKFLPPPRSLESVICS